MTTNNNTKYTLILLLAAVFFTTFFYSPPDSNGDHARTTCEIVEARGFECEVHFVRTDQDYMLEVHRVAPFHFGPRRLHSRPVVIQHGLTGSSVNFVFASEWVNFAPGAWGPNLALEMAKLGYDVWLPNNRGNTYGLRHLKYTTLDRQFWNFTFEDISRYDLPAVIDYVRDVTKQAKVAYIGHSQGTTIMFSLMANSTQQRLDTKAIEPFIAISPVTRIGDATSPLRFYAEIIYRFISDWEQPSFMAYSWVKTVKDHLCWNLPSVCKFITFSMCGVNRDQLNETRVMVYASHLSSTSRRNLIYFRQLFKSNRFARFDHGPEVNLELYGQRDPPDFDLTEIDHQHTYVIYSLNDVFTSIASIDRLKRELKAREFYEIQDPDASHCDPLFGIDVAVEVNHKIASILNQYHNS